MVFDGRVSHSDAPDRGMHETLTLTDAVFHVLGDGYGFNLDTKRPFLPGGKEIEERAVGAGQSP